MADSALPPAAPSAGEPSLEELSASLAEVNARVSAAEKKRITDQGPSYQQRVRLVAVSKTKSVECVRNAYEAGQRVFGENYVNEITDKAPRMPPDTVWRFIGHLQSNKAKELVQGVDSLECVETVDSAKLASKLDAAVAGSKRADRPLDVLIQVNTSGEESKSGVEPADGSAVTLAKHILKECPRLRLKGFMTIGMPDYTSTPENFACLLRVREATGAELGIPVDALELSMGMSGDYEAAIAMGSTNVRVGSTIFGKRAVVKRPATPPASQQQQQ